MSLHSFNSQSSLGSSTLHHPPSLSNRLKTACPKWRMLQWGAFTLLVIGVAVWANVAASRKEEDAFQSAFKQTAAQLLQYSDQAMQSTITLLQSLGTTATVSTAADAWPYVRIPSFDTIAQDYIDQSGAGIVGFAPLVNDPAEWGRYVYSEQLDQVVTPYIFNMEFEVRVQQFGTEGVIHAPLWQVHPITTTDDNFINYNLFDAPWIGDLLLAARDDQQPQISGILDPDDIVAVFPDASGKIATDVWSMLVQPIFRTVDNTEVVGYLLSLFPWGVTLFENSLGWNGDNGKQSVLCVLRGEDNEAYTYRVQGSQVEYLGPGDAPVESDAHGDDPAQSQSTMKGQRRLQTESSESSQSMMPFTVDVYPTTEFYDSYTTSLPALYTVLVILILASLALWFAICQYLQERENNTNSRIKDALGGVDWTRASSEKNRGLRGNNKQLMNAFLSDQKQGTTDPSGEMSIDDFEHGLEESTKLENDSHRSRIADQSQRNRNIDQSHRSRNIDQSHRSRNPGDVNHLLPLSIRDSKPIADLFPSASVSMADISGFTAWASVREPSTAFTLLESLYHAFDKLAQQKGVFKVETIGDCYTAVCGLPERRSDHAVALCLYARGCLRRFRDLTHKLEEKLGPETTELSLRIGINTGPIMAGILRGESQARFQLFGETVSLASTIENTGEGGRIHMSKETAAQLNEEGKGHWLIKREDKIQTSKGDLQTFWLADESTRRFSKNQRQPSGLSDYSLMDESGWEASNLPEQAPSNQFHGEEARTKRLRLVGWNCEIMIPLLKMIVARRNAEKKQKVLVENGDAVSQLEGWIGSTDNVLDEVEEVISLPHYDGKVQKKIKSDLGKLELGSDVTDQLREFVEILASLYLNNPFHNFEHASHVTMSTSKLLSRIVAPEDVICWDNKKKKDVAADLHDCTYGITSDPLTQFAVILSALIHDVDHRGVPNNILSNEEPELAAVYHNKSVAEQNSVDIAWECLMDPRFVQLRKCIYGDSEAELKRFRVLLVNCVMSTDIFDKELSSLRKARWQKAFSVPDEDAATEDINRKATIVIEHLIQASDVSHTMQHWHVYQKWNEKLFQEMYTAYRLGRSDKDPSGGWYKGEIWFYDNYVIPLAKKLKDCGVFGVSSDEYLTYAENNRNEWEEKGESIVKSMVEKYKVMMDDYEPKKIESKAKGKTKGAQ